MKLSQLSEVIWRFQNEGNASVKGQTFRQADIQQAVITAYGNFMRQLYYANKALKEGDEYYFYSGDLDIREFDLSDANIVGMRRAVIPDEVVRLPKNADITNVYPVGQCNGAVGEITQVQPAEENFYLSPDFTEFLFFVQKGKGINVYHVPPCVKSIQVERIYITDDFEITVDIAWDIAKDVWKNILQIKGMWDGDQVELRKKIQIQEGVVA